MEGFIPDNEEHSLVNKVPVGDWVLNLRAAGEAILTRDRSSETVTTRELSSEEAAPILREEIKNGHPFAQVYGVTADSSLEEFEQALVDRPVFLLERK
jgi:imidazolonepropionase-like amidohydrolase